MALKFHCWAIKSFHARRGPKCRNQPALAGKESTAGFSGDSRGQTLGCHGALGDRSAANQPSQGNRPIPIKAKCGFLANLFQICVGRSGNGCGRLSTRISADGPQRRGGGTLAPSGQCQSHRADVYNEQLSYVRRLRSLVIVVGLLEAEAMRRAILVAPLAVCLTVFAAPAWAFCVTGDGAQGCPLPFSNSSNSAQPDGVSTRQGFDAQSGSQWSSTTQKAGDFTFYSGVSSGNSWDARQRFFGNGLNGPGFGSQDQANSPHCAFYGNCQ
jgi:hypothetical protein